MLSAALVGLSCLGSWAFFPLSDDSVAFNLVLRDDRTFEALFTDYSRSMGTWYRQADGSYELLEGDNPTFSVTCSAQSAEITLLEEVNPPRQFSANRFAGSFVSEATSRGFFEPQEPELPEQPVTPEWRDVNFPRWSVNRTGNIPYQQCELSLRDRSLVIRTNASTSGPLVVNADIRTPMSRLRATTSDDPNRLTMVFDGDVTLSPTIAMRVGRTLIGGQFADDGRLLRYFAEASRVSFLADGELTSTFNLSGSSAAVAALGRCMAT